MKTRTRTFGLLAAAALTALTLTSCSSGNAAPEAADAPKENVAVPAAEQDVKIGILQLAPHPALDAARDGFVEELEAAGFKTIEIDVQNAQGESATANTIAQSFAGADLDLVLAIATQGAQAAVQNISDIPVLFTAVTDAVDTGLVDSNEKPGGNVTGTSDLNPVADQIELITKINPDAKKVGFLYSSAETNSLVQIELARTAAEDLGLEIVEKTVSNGNEVSAAATALGDVDAIYVPTDNTVVNAIGAVIAVAEKQGALLIGSESGQVDQGAAATLGLNYAELGKQTGQMAVRILTEGADPASTPVETLTTAELVLNPGAAKLMGFTIPQDMIDSATRVVK